MADKTDAPSMSTDGTPQIYFDQMNHINSHLHDITKTQQQINHNGNQNLTMSQVHYIHGILDKMRPTTTTDLKTRIHRSTVNKLKRSELIKSGDWNEWEQTEWKQLNQYNEQKMFGKPCQRQHGKGLFNLVWTHYLKTDGTNTLKARCTCDGSP